MKYFTGIDISKNTFNVHIIDHHGKTVNSFKLSQKTQDFSKLLSVLSQLSDPHDIAIGIESSGNYHINLLSFLISHNFPVYLINPILVYNFRKSSSLRKTKTDKIDAKTIANFILKHKNSLKKFSPDNSVKLLARERESLAQDIARLKTQIQQLVFNIFKELLDYHNVTSSKFWLQFLLHIPSARVARQMGPEEIQEIIDQLKEGKGRRIGITASYILQIANNTISIDDPNRESILKSRIRRLLYLQGEIKALTSELIEKIQCFRPEEMKVLTSMPGIGEVSAASFLAEVQDIKRFNGSYKKFIAFAGLDPVIYESGQYRRRLRISKRGSPHLRRIIWGMTIGSIFHTNVFKEYYMKKRREGKSHKRAVISTSNKLMRVLFYFLENGGIFRDSPPQIIHS